MSSPSMSGTGWSSSMGSAPQTRSPGRIALCNASPPRPHSLCVTVQRIARESDMTVTQDARFIRAESALADIGGNAARYGLVVVLGWIGALKFTSYEAYGIEPLVANSPLLSWVYDIFSVTAFSSLLGVLARSEERRVGKGCV